MTCYSDVQLAAALRHAGVNAGDAAILVATSHPESGGCGVMQQGQPYATTGWGPWQITPGNSEPQCGTNAQLFGLGPAGCAAAAKLRSQGLSAWTTYVAGLYLPYLTAAKNAVAQVYGMSQQQINSLIHSTGSTPGGGSPAGAGAQTAGFSLFDPSSWINAFLSAFGVPNLKDLAIRGGLILLGAALVIVGLVVFSASLGKQAVNIVTPSGGGSSSSNEGSSAETAAAESSTAAEGAEVAAVV